MACEIQSEAVIHLDSGTRTPSYEVQAFRAGNPQGLMLTLNQHVYAHWGRCWGVRAGVSARLSMGIEHGTAPGASRQARGTPALAVGAEKPMHSFRLSSLNSAGRWTQVSILWHCSAARGKLKRAEHVARRCSTLNRQGSEATGRPCAIRSPRRSPRRSSEPDTTSVISYSDNWQTRRRRNPSLGLIGSDQGRGAYSSRSGSRLRH